MNYDVPKLSIITSKPPAEVRIMNHGNQNTGMYGAPGPQPKAPDLGGYPAYITVSGTLGTSNASMVSSNVTAYYATPYIIPRSGPILEVEAEKQIENYRLSEAAEIEK